MELADGAKPQAGEPPRPRILAFATKGAGSNEEDRLRALLSRHAVDYFPFDRRSIGSSSSTKSLISLPAAVQSKASMCVPTVSIVA